MIAHFQMMARYNRWANRRLLGAAAGLPADALWADRGVFFHSFLGTLNHLLVADTLWFCRLEARPVPSGLKLDSVLHRDLGEFASAREVMDETIISFMINLDPARLDTELSFHTTTGIEVSAPFAPTLIHLFNHHAHHRGQAHGVLTGLGGEGPALDLLYYLREGGA